MFIICVFFFILLWVFSPLHICGLICSISFRNSTMILKTILRLKTNQICVWRAQTQEAMQIKPHKLDYNGWNLKYDECSTHSIVKYSCRSLNLLSLLRGCHHNSTLNITWHQTQVYILDQHWIIPTKSHYINNMTTYSRHVTKLSQSLEYEPSTILTCHKLWKLCRSHPWIMGGWNSIYHKNWWKN